MLMSEVLRDHGVGLGKYKKNSLIRNVNLSNPIWTLKKSWTSTSSANSRFFLTDSSDLYLYFTNDGSRNVLEKRFYSNGGSVWSSNVGEGIQDAALDSQGNIWIVTPSKVRKYTPSGSYTEFAANGGGYNIYVDSSDNVYVVGLTKAFSITNSGGNRWSYSYTNGQTSMTSVLGAEGLYIFLPHPQTIYKLSLAGSLIISRTANFSTGNNFKGVATKNDTLFLGSNSTSSKWDKNLNQLPTLAPNQGYSYSTNIVKDVNDNLYIGFDYGNYVLAALNDNLTLRTSVELTHSSSTQAIGIDNNGCLIVSDGNTIKSYDLSFTILG